MIPCTLSATHTISYLLKVHAFEAVKTFVWFSILPIARLTDQIRKDEGEEFTYEISVYQYYYMGLVGLAKFAIACAVFMGAAMLWHPLFAAVLGSVTYILLSGGIHLDGLTDTLDALFAYGKDRWEVLKDPHIGAIGAAYLNIYLWLFFPLLAYSLYWSMAQDTFLPLVALAHVFILPKLNCYIVLNDYIDTGEVKLDKHMQLTPHYHFWQNRRLTSTLGFYSITTALLVLELFLVGPDPRFLAFLATAFLVMLLFNARVLRPVIKELQFLAGDLFGFMICLLELVFLFLYALYFVRAL